MKRIAAQVIGLVVIIAVPPSAIYVGAESTKIPVIYCTDLFHPHDDPDDHFDVACLYALPEIDIRAVILDQGAKQEKRPGKIPVEQLNHLTGRNVPSAIGLSQKLATPADQRITEPDRYQGGVNLIVSVLKEAKSPVAIITVGSVRDVAAAFNREPELFRKKVSRLLIFIGDAKGAFQEYNVGLDPCAYACVMNSGLPVYWVPCFDGGPRRNDGHASFWQAKHSDLLRDASDPLMNYFIYALLRKTEKDHIGFLHRAVSEDEKSKVLAGTRNLWCAAVFAFAANRKFVCRDGDWLSAQPSDVPEGYTVREVFGFSPVSVYVDAAGKVFYEDSSRSHRINRFEILDRDSYADAMTSVTRHLIGTLSRSMVGAGDHKQIPPGSPSLAASKVTVIVMLDRCVRAR